MGNTRELTQGKHFAYSNSSQFLAAQRLRLTGQCHIITTLTYCYNNAINRIF